MKKHKQIKPGQIREIRFHKDLIEKYKHLMVNGDQGIGEQVGPLFGVFYDLKCILETYFHRGKL